jgi:hypothetical protein
MAWEHKEGSGALFKNAKKEKDSHPDYRGDAMVNGTLMEIAAWIKEGKNGGKFMSLSIKPKPDRDEVPMIFSSRDYDEKTKPAPAPEKKAPSKFDFLDDPTPF